MPARKLYFIGIVFCLTHTFVGEAEACQAEASDLRLESIQQKIISGDLNAATAELEKAILHSPRDPRLYNFRGVIEAQKKRFATAEASFHKAIQFAPGFSDAYLNLGRLYQEHPNEPRSLEKAITIYQSLLKQNPGHVEANYQAASLLNRAGSYTASLQHLSRLPLQSQGRAAALALRCANNFALGKTTEGEAAATQLLASSDLTELDVLPILSILANQGEDVAILLLTGLEKRGLASSDTIVKLATVYERQGQFKEARAVLEKSPELAHPSAAFLVRIAQLAYRAGELEGALGYLARARDLEPANAKIHFFFGMICIDLKLPPEAKASLQEALRLEPNNPHYNYAFGAVLVGQKNADEAIRHFQKYRDARPDDPRGSFALGVAYFEAYQMDRAGQVLLSVVDNPETRTGAQLYLGRIALSTGRTDEALIHFQEAIKSNPKATDAYAEAALVRIRREEYNLAEKGLTTALGISPDHYLSNLRLLMLYQRTKDSRAAAQTKRVEDLRKAGEEKERLLLRSLEIRPY